MKSKNGFTLIELLICITLVSIVVIFLFRLINTVRNDEKYIGYIRSNQSNRNQIMDEVGTLISRYGVKGVNVLSYSDSGSSLDFVLNNNKHLIIAVSRSSVLVTYDGISTSYEMSDQSAWYEPKFVHTTGDFSGYEYNKYVFKTEKRGMEHSSIDDIEIMYIDYKKSYAIFDTGDNINKKIHELSGNTNYIGSGDNKIYRENNNVLKIVRSNHAPDASNYIDVSSSESNAPIYMWYKNNVIYYYSNLENIELNQDASNMFNYLVAVEDIDLTGVETFKTTDMHNMFASCSSLKELDISSFNTFLVTNMSEMFYQNSSLTRIYVSDAFSTSNITNANNMFRDDLNLIGGRGMHYSKNKVDGLMARINTINEEGYLTDVKVVCKGVHLDLKTADVPYEDCYKSLQAAIDDTTSGDLTLFQDVYEDIVVPSGYRNNFQIYSPLHAKTIGLSNGEVTIYGDVTNNSDNGFVLNHRTRVVGYITNNGVMASLNNIIGKVVNTKTYSMQGGSITLNGNLWAFHNAEGSSLTMSNVTIDHTNAGDATSLYNAGTATVSSSTINSSGFGVVNHGGTLTISSCYVTRTSGNHNAILNRNNGTTTVNGSLITGPVNNAVDNPDKFRLYESQVNGLVEGKVIYRKVESTNSGPVVQWRLYGYATSGFTQVAFPTWTAYNGQDDLTWNSVTSTVTDQSGTFYYQNIYKSAHNNETGEYYTHVYVYPTGGSMYNVGSYSFNYPTS